MQARHHLIATTFIVLLAAGCEPTTPPGKNAGTEQIRSSMTPALRSAGVSDACIQQLSTSTLGQIKGITSNSPRSSVEVLQQRQRIRTTAAKDCGVV